MSSFNGLYTGDAFEVGSYDSLVPPPLMGDFYREPDDVVRGVSIDSFAFDFDSYAGHLAPWEAMKVIDESTQSSPSLHAQAYRFHALQEGRSVPDDPFFLLEKTTQYLAGVSPATAGNHVLDFLELSIPSAITKVSDKKITIKAEAFHAGHACLIKVYIYRQQSGCAVEFQRRSGDAIAFLRTYEKAAEYLSEHTGSQGSLLSPAHSEPSLASASSSAPALPTAPQMAMAVDFSEETAVLLQLAQEAPHLQEEIASSILGIVEEESSQHLAEWCKPEAMEVLLKLLASDRFVAAYPAARLLARLADLPEARSHFFNECLLKSVLARLWVQATGMAVWLELARLVHRVVSTYAAHMTGPESQEVAHAISYALALEPTQRATNVSQWLREARELLGNDSFKGRHGAQEVPFAQCNY